jgi:uncharacterized protein YbgA (DUF1722 family)
MLHAIGHLKRLMQPGDREAGGGDRADVAKLPAGRSITLLRHHVCRHDVGYLKDQTYLELHPRELALPNHV